MDQQRDEHRGGETVRRVPVNATSLNTQRKLLAFATVMEAGTGLFLMIDTAIVVNLLFGLEASGAATQLGRCFGIALLALGLACWPRPARRLFGRCCSTTY